MSGRAFSQERLAGMRESLSRHVRNGDLPGLVSLVSRHGETHVETIGRMAMGGGAPMRRDTIFRIASMTKPVTAVAALILIEECRLRLDDPVDGFLPELADRQVLRSLDSPLDDTVPAERPISVRDLLTFELGIGAIMADPGTYPIQIAMQERGLSPGPDAPNLTPDEYMQRIGGLPLIYQPGESWMYHTGSDILGVLIARVAGRPLGAFLKERVFAPLGMSDTGFHVPPEKLYRLPPSYMSGPSGHGLVMQEDTTTSRYNSPPSFPSGGGGLVSTADDYLAFCRMLLAKGRHGDTRILSRPSIELMTSDRLSEKQRSGAKLFFGDHRSWGFGLSVAIQRDDFGAAGRFGWDGGRGTSGYADPAEDLVGILMTQRMMESPQPPPVFRDFWTSAYQAIED